MSATAAYISIGDLAEKAQVSVPTLRRWDHIGKLKPAMRLGNGTRLYSPEQVEQCIEERRKELQGKLDALNKMK